MLRKKAALQTDRLFNTLFFSAITVLTHWQEQRRELEAHQHSDSGLGAPSSETSDTHSVQSFNDTDFGVTDSEAELHPTDYERSCVLEISNIIRQHARLKSLPAHMAYFGSQYRNYDLSSNSKQIFSDIYKLSNSHKSKAWQHQSCTTPHSEGLDRLLFFLALDVRKSGITHLRFGTTTVINIQSIASPNDVCQAFSNPDVLSHQHHRKHRENHKSRLQPNDIRFSAY